MSYLGRSAKLSLKAQEKVSFLATAGQTVKTGLSYTVGFIEVYVNGVLLTDTTDFTATNGNSITFTVALLVNDEVTVISLKTFTVADHYTKSDADTLLAAKSTVASPVFTGNVGVGVTTEAWDSQWAALQIGGLSSYISPIAANVNQALMINNNAYYDGSWKYQITDESSSYYQLHGAHTFRVAASGNADSAISWTTAMSIDNAGLVTKPYQAGFYARRSTNGDNRASGAQEWAITGTASRNTGNHFLASNGRFTAPVDGVYFFAATPAYKQSNITLSWNFRVNGTDIAEAVRLIGALDSHSTIGGSTIMKLTASDYVDLNISGLHHANTSYNYFCGHLIS